MHWGTHWSGVPPPWTHVVKQVTSLMQLGDWKQERSCPQHLLATQSLHAPPPDGHCCAPHTPLAHWPVQHSPGVMHENPSALHCCPHVPLAHTPLQQSAKPMHMPPSGEQAFWQTPPMQLPEQQFGPDAHICPFWAQAPHAAPHRLCASWTQIPSQL